MSPLTNQPTVCHKQNGSCFDESLAKSIKKHIPVLPHAALTELGMY